MTCALSPAFAPPRAAVVPRLRVPPAPVFMSIPLSGRRLEGIDTGALFATLSNDFFHEDDGTVYVQTGDIPAMWLRDSSAQTLPYVRFAPQFPELRRLVAGVIARDEKNILTDPYANAFTEAYRIWERKWEIDSLAYPVELAYVYWDQTQRRDIFTAKLHYALIAIVRTYACEQRHAVCSHYRSVAAPENDQNAAETGMIWSAFRPSDDECELPYNIPQEMFATTALQHIAALAVAGFGDAGLAAHARDLATEIRAGIDRYGMAYSFRYGWIYAYEVDGRGAIRLMDDANIPDLLTAPLYGFAYKADALYLRTRNFVLSGDNPYYFTGRYAAGLGSPHTPTGWVWPLGLIGRALTAGSSSEVLEEISILSETDAKDGLLHESFDPNRYWHFTRTSFGWANALYAELLFRSVAGFPEIFPPVLPIGVTPTGPIRLVTPHITTRIDQVRNQIIIHQALCTLLRFSAEARNCPATPAPTQAPRPRTAHTQAPHPRPRRS